MRVKEMADLAGTTTRTVRYYHRLGLLPVPPTRGAQRSYDIEHLARLLRIRWLVRSGVPLKRVASLLDKDTGSGEHPGEGAGAGPAALADSALTDLRATRTEIDARIAELEHQRRRIDLLIAKAASGKPLSPLPRTVTDYYGDLESRLSSPGARRTLRAKQHMLTLLVVSGMFPATAVGLFLEEYEQERDTVIDLFERFDSLKGQSLARPDTRERAHDLAREMCSLITRHRHSARDLMSSFTGGRISPGVWAVYGPLLRATYPDPVHRVVVDEVLSSIAADPVLSTVIDPAVRKEWLRV